MQFEKLSKKGGARMHDVQTYKIYCENKDIIGYKTIKSASEVADTDFTHVLLSKLGQIQKNVIVKIHEAHSLFAQRELHALKILSGTSFERNSVKYICDFTCIDDKNKWINNIKKNISFCTQGKDELHFIVMEYIENADLIDFFNNKPSIKEIKSLFIQTMLILMDLAFNYKIYHGDLNSGNILVRKTKKKTATYHINNKVHRINTYGINPILLDYGRGGIYKNNIDHNEVMDDIMTIFYTFSTLIQNNELKLKIRLFIENNNTINFEDCIQQIRQLFSSSN